MGPEPTHISTDDGDEIRIIADDGHELRIIWRSSPRNRVLSRRERREQRYQLEQRVRRGVRERQVLLKAFLATFFVQDLGVGKAIEALRARHAPVVERIGSYEQLAMALHYTVASMQYGNGRNPWNWVTQGQVDSCLADLDKFAELLGLPAYWGPWAVFYAMLTDSFRVPLPPGQYPAFGLDGDYYVQDRGRPSTVLQEHARWLALYLRGAPLTDIAESASKRRPSALDEKQIRRGIRKAARLLELNVTRKVGRPRLPRRSRAP